MKPILLIAVGLGLAIGVWFGYFWLEEQRKWSTGIPVLSERTLSRHRCEWMEARP